MFQQYLCWSIFLVLLSCHSRSYRLAEKSAPSQSISIDIQNQEFEKITSFIKPYKQKIDSSLSQVVANNAQDLKKGVPESSLTNAFADWMLWKAKKMDSLKADVAIFNLGGLRTEWGKGLIKKSDVFELMPFENELVSVEISISDFEKLIQIINQKPGAPIAGFKLKLKDGEKVKFELNNHTRQTVWVVTSDYLINGGDNFDFGTIINKNYYGISLRQAIFDRFESAQPNQFIIMSETDGRVVYE